MTVNEEFDVVIIGAGAAGLMCAIEAGRRGRRVLVIEHAERVGKKILISGGGRCNFTNVYCAPANFISQNAHFAKSALARYTPENFLALVEAHGIAWHEKTMGQLFCDGSAAQIVAMLVAECVEAGVQILTATTVSGVERIGSRPTDMPGEAADLREPQHAPLPPDMEAAEPSNRSVSVREFQIRTNRASFCAQKLVIATGGLSIPKMGATGFGYDLARQFGLKIYLPRPALVPLLLDDADREGLCDLAGVSTGVEVGIGKTRFREKLLVTHRGLSGPAVLQISSYWDGAGEIDIDWAPGVELLAPLLAPAPPALVPSKHLKSSTGLSIAAVPPARPRRDANAARAALRNHLPGRLADRLVELAGASDWSNSGIAALEAQLHRWTFTPGGTEGYDKAEVTAGGIDTAELSAQTMESRRVSGLYFIGEVVDVTGQLGGFNFQWAWASGAAAGRAV
ncbi:MAG TPA: NAD(P)/FAD-dependent oxidoreductase [Acidisarcina sp.]